MPEKAANRKVTKYGLENMRNSWLLESGRVHPDDLDRYGWPLIANAVNSGNIVVVTEFLKKGANPNPTDEKGNPVGLVGLSIGDPEITRMLCVAGANPNTPNEPDSGSPLHNALISFNAHPDYSKSANIIRAYGGVRDEVEDRNFRLIQANVRPDGQFLIRGPMPELPKFYELPEIGDMLAISKIYLHNSRAHQDSTALSDLRIRCTPTKCKPEWGVIRLEQHDDIIVCLLGPRHFSVLHANATKERKKFVEDGLVCAGFYTRLACFSQVKPGTKLKVMNLKLV